MFQRSCGMASRCPRTDLPKCPYGVQTLRPRINWIELKLPHGSGLWRTTSGQCKGISCSVRLTKPERDGFAIPAKLRAERLHKNCKGVDEQRAELCHNTKACPQNHTPAVVTSIKLAQSGGHFGLFSACAPAIIRLRDSRWRHIAAVGCAQLCAKAPNLKQRVGNYVGLSATLSELQSDRSCDGRVSDEQY
jgi:hypothetical protein